MTDIKDFRTAQIEQGELWEELRVEGTWYHVVRSFVTKGVLARLDGSAVKVYLVIKAFTDLQTGRARPSIARVAELAGVSHDTVQRAVKALEKEELITVDRLSNKTNEYLVHEHIPLNTMDDQPFAIASRPYSGNTFQPFINELKQFAATGNLPPDGKIVINLTVNNYNGPVHQGDNISNTGSGNVTVQKIEIAAGSHAEGAAKVKSEIDKLRRLRDI